MKRSDESSRQIKAHWGDTPHVCGIQKYAAARTTASGRSIQEFGLNSDCHMRWFSKKDTKDTRERYLVRRLKSYPAYRAPYAGVPWSLTIQQAEANLSYLLDNRQERLRILGNVLSEGGVNLASDLSTADPSDLLAQLHTWTKRYWPSIFDRRLASIDTWLASSREGREIVYSLLIDVAILLGDLVVTRKPQYMWSLDLNPENENAPLRGKDGMVSYKRPVVQIPKRGPFPAPIILDFEDIVVGLYRRVESPVFGSVNEIGQAASYAINGAYEAFWLAEARKAEKHGGPPA